jgi:16S rRNA (adenine1518-N6/adenine1519-N6)-dimethyltransferase
MNGPSYPPLKSLSQNFLRHETTAQNMVNKLSLTRKDVVVELGAGRGALTFFLAEKVSRVLAVEIDAGHSQELKEKVDRSGKDNIEVIHSDLLKADWRDWFDRLGGPFYIIGNLPYHISTPTLFKIVENRSFLEAAFVMLQKEVADRLLAKPGTKEYGVLTILIGTYVRARALMQLSPGSFYPKPRVSSTFVEIRFREATPGIKNEDLFQWLVRSAFGQRRKQIKNALTADGRFPASIITRVLEMNQIDLQSRGEILTINQFVSLSNTLAAETADIRL